MAYSTGPYQAFTTLPPVTRNVLVSSQTIDFARRLVVVDADGNPTAMSDVGQRVMLKVSMAVKPQPFITAKNLAQTEADIRVSLADMATGPQPEITILEVSATNPLSGTARYLVNYLDLTNGQKSSVTVTATPP